MHKINYMTPSTDTLKQKESWEKEFSSIMIEWIRNDWEILELRAQGKIWSALDKEKHDNEMTNCMKSFIKGLLHQTQQAERENLLKTIKGDEELNEYLRNPLHTSVRVKLDDLLQKLEEHD